jgi:hypothetical protein
MNAWGTVGGAIAPFLAVVVALAIAIWSDWFRFLFSRPKINVKISMETPDCHRIRASVQIPVYGAPLLNPGALPAAPPLPLAFDANYLRAVADDGHAPASGASVRAIRPSRLEGGVYKDDPHFMSMDLTWTYAQGSTVATRSTQSGRSIATSPISMGRVPTVFSSARVNAQHGGS